MQVKDVRKSLILAKRLRMRVQNLFKVYAQTIRKGLVAPLPHHGPILSTQRILNLIIHHYSCALVLELTPNDHPN